MNGKHMRVAGETWKPWFEVIDVDGKPENYRSAQEILASTRTLVYKRTIDLLLNIFVPLLDALLLIQQI